MHPVPCTQAVLSEAPRSVLEGTWFILGGSSPFSSPELEQGLMISLVIRPRDGPAVVAGKFPHVM